mgnify:CR=1 FL=1
MIGVLPRPSFMGVIDYMAFAAGLTIGVALFKPLADGIESAVSSKSKGNQG